MRKKFETLRDGMLVRSSCDPIFNLNGDSRALRMPRTAAFTSIDTIRRQTAHPSYHKCLQRHSARTGSLQDHSGAYMNCIHQIQLFIIKWANNQLSDQNENQAMMT